MSLRIRLQACVWGAVCVVLSTGRLWAATAIALPSPATPNTTAIAGALQRICAQLLALPNSAAGVPAEQDLARQCPFFENATPAAVAPAYAAIQGQQITALSPLIGEFASLQHDDLTERLAEVRQGAHGVDLTGVNLRGSDDGLMRAGGPTLMDFLPAPAGGSDSAPAWLDGRLGFFVNGNVTIGSKMNTPNNYAFDVKKNLITIGGDYRVTDWLVTGAAYGGGQTRVLFANNLGRMDLHDNGLSVYASLYHSAFYLDFLAGYGVSRLSLDRGVDFSNTISAAPVDQQAVGSTNVHNVWTGLSLGEDVNWHQILITPEASLNWRQGQLDSFTESMSQPAAAGSGLALAYGSTTVDFVQARLGVSIGGTWSSPWGVFQPQIHGMAIRDLINEPNTYSVRFASAENLGGAVDTPVTISGDYPVQQYYALGASIRATLPRGFSAFFDYEQMTHTLSMKAHQLSFGVRCQLGD